MAAIVGIGLVRYAGAGRSSWLRRGRYPAVNPTVPLRRRRCLIALGLVAVLAGGCNKNEPPAPAPKNPQASAAPHKSAPAATSERREYTDMPTGTQTYSHTTEQAIAAEALRGGPRGEPRIFESPEEIAELSRGRSPKSMNAQFRYYLASVAVVQPQGECKKPLLAVKLAVENLHGTPTSAIYGEFTFTQVVGGDGSALTETVAVPYRADIIGPFSNQQGGFVYVTAYLEQSDALHDGERWAQIAAVNPQRLKVWFRPEAFYYADHTQYAQRTGKMAAQREVMTCGGSEGSRPALQ